MSIAVGASPQWRQHPIEIQNNRVKIPTTLLYDVKTRWNSTLNMLERSVRYGNSPSTGYKPMLSLRLSGQPRRSGGRLNTSWRQFNRYDFGLCGCQKHLASPFIQCFKCIKISLIMSKCKFPSYNGSGCNRRLIFVKAY